MGTSLPEPLVSVYIRVTAAGGTQLHLVADRQLITLEAFASRESTAQLVLIDTIATLQALGNQAGQLGNETCHSVEIVSSPQNFPLASVPDRKRYVATIAAVLRRRTITTI